jgi:hypothetical protein
MFENEERTIKMLKDNVYEFYNKAAAINYKLEPVQKLNYLNQCVETYESLVRVQESLINKYKTYHDGTEKVIGVKVQSMIDQLQEVLDDE